jgi:hypothetical protein
VQDGFPRLSPSAFLCKRLHFYSLVGVGVTSLVGNHFGFVGISLSPASMQAIPSSTKNAPPPAAAQPKAYSWFGRMASVIIAAPNRTAAARIKTAPVMSFMTISYRSTPPESGRRPLILLSRAGWCHAVKQDVRAWSAWALGEIADEAGIDPLISAMEKYSALVLTDHLREQTGCIEDFAAALHKLSGRDLEPIRITPKTYTNPQFSCQNGMRQGVSRIGS